MNTTEALLRLLGGFALLLVGAEVMVRYASRLGLRLGMRPLTVGATIVAFGTSAPELIVSVTASLQGRGGIAIGNVVGSNIANIALVLGVAALLRPIPADRQMFRLEVPVALLSAFAVPIVCWDHVITVMEGAALVGGFVVFLLVYLVRARLANRHPDLGIREEEVRATHPAISVLGCVVGLGMLIFGSDLAVVGAVSLADAWGFSGTAVGATLVAVGTSLPEFATSVVAALKGAHGIAVGNVLGSNVFNILLALGAAGIANPMGVGGLERDQLNWIMVGLTVILIPILGSGRRIHRLEGLLLLGVYVYFLWVIQSDGRV